MKLENFIKERFIDNLLIKSNDLNFDWAKMHDLELDDILCTFKFNMNIEEYHNIKFDVYCGLFEQMLFDFIFHILSSNIIELDTNLIKTSINDGNLFDQYGLYIGKASNSKRSFKLHSPILNITKTISSLNINKLTEKSFQFEINLYMSNNVSIQELF